MGDRLFLPAREIVDDQVLVANETDIVAQRREFGVGLVACGVVRRCTAFSGLARRS